SSPRTRGPRLRSLSVLLRSIGPGVSLLSPGTTGSKLVLPRPDLGEHIRRRLPCHSDIHGKFGQVGTEERIGKFFLADGDRNRRFAVFDLPKRLRLPRGQRRIVLVDREGEFDVRQRVLVPAIDL